MPTAPSLPSYIPDYSLARERIKAFFLWFTIVSGFFVLSEPSPYEILCLITGVLFFIGGARVPRIAWFLIFMLLIWLVGGFISILQVLHEERVVLWMFVSAFMGATAVIFTAMIYDNPLQNIRIIRSSIILAGALSGLLAIVGYFLNIELLLRFERSKALFEDPNVLGAFLIFPALLCAQSIFERGLRVSFPLFVALMLIVAGVFLSFSRAAWGMLIFSGLLLAFLMFISANNAKDRQRIVLILLLTVVVMIVALAVLLSIPKVFDLFAQRASLEQDYDLGHLGRFGRHILGFIMVMDEPWGIGPLQFIRYFPEDPHNTFLAAFLYYGWIGGFAWIALIFSTLIISARGVFADIPWRGAHVAAFCAFVGLTIESFIIDVDHWRHYWLLLGVLWGSSAAIAKWQR